MAQKGFYVTAFDITKEMIEKEGLIMFKGKNKVLVVAISIIAGFVIGLLLGLLLNQEVWCSIIGAIAGVVIGSIVYTNIDKD